MSRRVSRSFKVTPGVRVRLNAKSTSVTVGGRGAHYTVNSNGRRTTTASVPGTGMSVQHQSGGHRSARTPTTAHVTSPAPKRSGPRDRHRLTKRGWIAIAVLVAVIAAIVVVVEVRHYDENRTYPPIPEGLTLTGPVSGHLTRAIEVKGMTGTFPAQQGEYGLGRVNATACVQNGGEGWEVDIYGQVGAHLMSLSFDGDGPDLSTTPYIGSHDIDNDPRQGGTVDFYWGSVEVDADRYSSSGGTLAVNRDGHSGTMNITLDTGTKMPEKITGSWRCA
jgi:Protein of unknown function (DUF4236)